MAGKTRSLIKKADLIFSKYIRQRDGRCQKCGTDQNLQCAHIISRGYKQIRHNLFNAIALCRGCHLYFTHHPIEFKQFIEKKNVGLWEMLEEMAINYHQKIDYEEIIKSLLPSDQV